MLIPYYFLDTDNTKRPLLFHKTPSYGSLHEDPFMKSLLPE